mmetsp:Transcript_159081/g.510181  ORF Transcript_159081/g.510181 Transcript_159081/m.510181 type:complete len:227 (+) Transcript_159081:208-888(+)
MVAGAEEPTSRKPLMSSKFLLIVESCASAEPAALDRSEAGPGAPVGRERLLAASGFFTSVERRPRTLMAPTEIGSGGAVSMGGKSISSCKATPVVETSSSSVAVAQVAQASTQPKASVAYSSARAPNCRASRCTAARIWPWPGAEMGRAAKLASTACAEATRSFSFSALATFSRCARRRRIAGQGSSASQAASCSTLTSCSQSRRRLNSSHTGLSCSTSSPKLIVP